MKNIRDILRELREDRDLKQSDIAKLIGTTQQQYSKYETGESELPIRALVALANYYDVSTDFLLGRTKYRKKISILNELLATNTTIGSLLSDILSLSPNGQSAVLDYIFLQRLKDKYDMNRK